SCRDGPNVGGDAAGLRGELADVGERGAPPLAAAHRLGFCERLPNVGIDRRWFARNQCRRPLAEQRRRGGNDRRLRGRRDARVNLEIGLHPVSRSQPNRFDAPDTDAAQHDRASRAEATDGPEAGDIHRLRLPEVRAGEPQRAAHDQRERGDDDDADGKLVLALHSARPSMNWRTTGSSVPWISSTLPTCRIRPSYSIAIRSPTV